MSNNSTPVAGPLPVSSSPPLNPSAKPFAPASPGLNPAAKAFKPGVQLQLNAGAMSPKSPSSRARSGTGDSTGLQPRRKRSSASDSAEMDTIVLKNLSSQLTPQDVYDFLIEKNLPPVGGEQGVFFHTDSTGTFRGTAFVKYANFPAVQEAVARLGGATELAGRKVKVEIQRKGRDSRLGLEAELSPEQVEVVQKLIRDFVASETVETTLPPTFDTKMRKYAHSLAERQGLAHVTQASDKEGKKNVYLSKLRPEGRKNRAGSTSSYSCSPLSSYQASPLLRFAATGSASPMQWAMEDMSLGPAVAPGAVGVLGPAAILEGGSAPGSKKLDPNSPPFYPSSSPPNNATNGMTEEWTLTAEEVPPTTGAAGYPKVEEKTAAAPDGTRGFRRPRSKSTASAISATSHASPTQGPQSVLAACETMAKA